MSESTAVLVAPATAPQEEPAQISSVQSVNRAVTEPLPVQAVLILLALGFLALFLVVPLFVVLSEALRGGAAAYREAVTHPEALAAIKTTLLVTAIVVPCNTVFGIAAAWAVAKFRFVGRSVLISLIDLPFAVSPVISGLIFVLLFGRGGILGDQVERLGIQVIFALPGILLATAFVTFPFVARELIAFMEAQGSEEEEAAVVLGASGWQTFWRVTLPNIKWGLLYGVILCSARAMGEFGAVSVVAGRVRGETTTIPLQVEYLYEDFQYTASFAVASILTVIGLVTLVVKHVLEVQALRQLKAGQTTDAH